MNYKELTKEKILKNEPSKFNMVPNLLPMEILITEKPSSLIAALANLLDIEPEDINANSFRKWRLRTIKKKHSFSPSSPPKVNERGLNQSKEKVDDSRYNNTVDDFIPIPAEEAKNKDEEPFIKAVKPTHPQNQKPTSKEF